MKIGADKRGSVQLGTGERPNVKPEMNMFQAYKDDLKRILQPNNLYQLQRNVDHVDQKSGIKYKIFFESGKQQFVFGVELTFPNSADVQRVVVRNVDNPERFKRIIDLHSEIKAEYPALHLDFSCAQGATFILQYIDGAEKLSSQRAGYKFQSYVDEHRLHEKLLEDSFRVIDKVFQLPLNLVDVVPNAGHNFIYDFNLGKFQLLDVDTIHEDKKGESVENKLMEMLQSADKYRDEELGYKFLFSLLVKFLAKYSAMTFQGPVGTLDSSVRIRTPKNLNDENKARANGKLIEFDSSLDSEYMQLVQLLPRFGSKDAIKCKTPLVAQPFSVKEYEGMPRKLFETVRDNDYSKFEQLILSGVKPYEKIRQEEDLPLSTPL